MLSSALSILMLIYLMLYIIDGIDITNAVNIVPEAGNFCDFFDYNFELVMDFYQVYVVHAA